MNIFNYCIRIAKIKLLVIKECLSSHEKEHRELLKYICRHRMNVFNYSFCKRYKRHAIQVHYDTQEGLKFVMFKGKRLYFKRSMSDREIRLYYNSILIEQDKQSPHLYMTEELMQKQYRCVLDIGAAEGNFSLDLVDQAEEIYIFEADEDWMEALKCTFKDYKEKVHLIHSFVSDSDSGKCKTLDHLLKHRSDIDLVKIDVEGEEISVLTGGKQIFSQNHPIYLVCVYHYGKQEKEVREYFKGYDIKARNGYMVFIWQEKLDRPLLRRGVLEVY